MQSMPPLPMLLPASDLGVSLAEATNISDAHQQDSAVTECCLCSAMKAQRSFHLAIIVNNLADARYFYETILGLVPEKILGSSIHYDFFGNQRVIHKMHQEAGKTRLGYSDLSSPPVPHFGANLTQEEFADIIDRVLEFQWDFLIRPDKRHEGTSFEQRVFFINDGEGNTLEFKTYVHQHSIDKG